MNFLLIKVTWIVYSQIVRIAAANLLKRQVSITERLNLDFWQQVSRIICLTIFFWQNECFFRKTFTHVEMITFFKSIILKGKTEVF